MSDGFTVILGDLRAMKSHFEREHEEYLQVATRLTPPRTATGDAHLDQTLAAVLDAVSIMHQNLAARIGEHAEKLGKAADSYERSDIGVHGLYDDLMAE